MNYYEEIKNKIINNEIYSKVKDYSKERNTVNTYFEIGRFLTEVGGKYSDNIIDEYSKKLVVEVGKKYIYIKWNDYIKFLVMKKSRQWCDNYFLLWSN